MSTLSNFWIICIAWSEWGLKTNGPYEKFFEYLVDRQIADEMLEQNSFQCWTWNLVVYFTDHWNKLAHWKTIRSDPIRLQMFHIFFVFIQSANRVRLLIPELDIVNKRQRVIYKCKNSLKMHNGKQFWSQFYTDRGSIKLSFLRGHIRLCPVSVQEVLKLCFENYESLRTTVRLCSHLSQT